MMNRTTPPPDRLAQAAEALRRAAAEAPDHPRAQAMAADLAAVDRLEPQAERERMRLRHLLDLHPDHPKAGAWRRQITAFTRSGDG